MTLQTDVDTFGSLYDNHMDAVFRYLYLRVGNRRLAEHLTCETFHRAVGRLTVLVDPQVDAGLWLICVARQAVADYQQRWPSEEMPVDLPAEQGNLEMITALWKLMPRHQDVLILRHLMNLTLAQTAQAMERSETSVRVLSPHAARALARHLPEGFVP